MARKKKRKKRPVQVSPEAKARASARLADRWRSEAAKSGRSGTPSAVLEKVFAPDAKLPSTNAKLEQAKAKQERRDASVARRQASSTSPGKGRPVPGGKPRGTGGRMKRGGS